jgi:hypothetical protein
MELNQTYFLLILINNGEILTYQAHRHKSAFPLLFKLCQNHCSVFSKTKIVCRYGLKSKVKLIRSSDYEMLFVNVPTQPFWVYMRKGRVYFHKFMINIDNKKKAIQHLTFLGNDRIMYIEENKIKIARFELSFKLDYYFPYKKLNLSTAPMHIKLVDGTEGKNTILCYAQEETKYSLMLINTNSSVIMDTFIGEQKEDCQAVEISHYSRETNEAILGVVTNVYGITNEVIQSKLAIYRLTSKIEKVYSLASKDIITSICIAGKYILVAQCLSLNVYKIETVSSNVVLSKVVSVESKLYIKEIRSLHKSFFLCSDIFNGIALYFFDEKLSKIFLIATDDSGIPILTSDFYVSSDFVILYSDINCNLYCASKSQDNKQQESEYIKSESAMTYHSPINRMHKINIGSRDYPNYITFISILLTRHV